MTKLQEWMDKRNLLDADVAVMAKTCRPHISRIRRGKGHCSYDMAKRLEAVTKIKWWNFIEGSRAKNEG